MAYLEYSVEEERYRHELTRVDTSIGRANECDLQLLHDPELSRIHCSVQRHVDGSYVLVDEEARNGTFLNGKRVFHEEVPLRDGDKINVGQTVLDFREEPEDEPEAEGKTGDKSEDVFDELAQEMKQGKGFKTLMQEIVKKR